MRKKMTGTTGGSETTSRRREGYSQTGGTVFRVLATRSMDRQGAFFLPYLKPGMRVLDCGSGPGTMTVGLAQAVSPGEVVGIDISEEDNQRARAYAAEKGVSNVRFQAGNAYAIPFPEGTFDAVFCHNVLEHLNEPVKALQEMRRVLRPGGVAGIRDVDNGGTLYSPDDPSIARWRELYRAHWRGVGGGSPFMGRHLKGLLLQAGLVRVEGSASYDVWSNPESLGAGIADRLSEPSFADWVVQQGLETRQGLEKLAAGAREWGSRPDAFWANAEGEAVGWKE